jgi:predicted dehydrogenase
MKQLGIAVIGSGRIGTLRAEMARRHPAVRFLAVADLDRDQVDKLAARVGADHHTTDPLSLIARDDIDAVFVSTPESAHVEAVIAALEAGKPVLVEKPLAMTLDGADRILSVLHERQGDLHVGYSRRFKECFLRSKEQLNHGRLGQVVGGMARVYNSRAQAFSILKRDPHATPVVDVLTYYVDLMGWFLDGNRPVEVIARGQKGVFRDAGYGADDVTWAIVTLEDGAVLNFGVSYALPSRYPTLGQSDRVELLGMTIISTISFIPMLVSLMLMCPIIRSTWHFWAATRPATGPSGISGVPWPMRVAPGSIASRWVVLPSIPRPVRRARTCL